MLIKPHVTPGLVLDWRIHAANALAPNSLVLWVSFSSALNISFMTGTFFCLIAKSIFALEILRTFTVVWWLCIWHHFSDYWKHNEGNKKCYRSKTTQLIPGYTCKWTVQHKRIIWEQKLNFSLWASELREAVMSIYTLAFGLSMQGPKMGKVSTSSTKHFCLWASHLGWFILAQLANPVSSAPKADAIVPL